MTTVTIFIARVRAMLNRRRLGIPPLRRAPVAARDRPVDGVAYGAGWSSASWRLPYVSDRDQDWWRPQSSVRRRLGCTRNDRVPASSVHLTGSASDGRRPVLTVNN